MKTSGPASSPVRPSSTVPSVTNRRIGSPPEVKLTVLPLITPTGLVSHYRYSRMRLSPTDRLRRRHRCCRRCRVNSLSLWPAMLVRVADAGVTAVGPSSWNANAVVMSRVVLAVSPSPSSIVASASQGSSQPAPPPRPRSRSGRPDRCAQPSGPAPVSPRRCRH